MALLHEIGRHPCHAEVHEVHVTECGDHGTPRHWTCQGRPKCAWIRLAGLSELGCGGTTVIHKGEPRNQPYETTGADHEEHSSPVVTSNQPCSQRSPDSRPDLGAGHV